MRWLRWVECTRGKGGRREGNGNHEWGRKRRRVGVERGLEVLEARKRIWMLFWLFVVAG